jgi:hypothetical protein
MVGTVKKATLYRGRSTTSPGCSPILSIHFPKQAPICNK